LQPVMHTRQRLYMKGSRHLHFTIMDR
jgi:hypothetical protein